MFWFILRNVYKVLILRIELFCLIWSLGFRSLVVFRNKLVFCCLIVEYVWFVFILVFDWVIDVRVVGFLIYIFFIVDVF